MCGHRFAKSAMPTATPTYVPGRAHTRLPLPAGTLAGFVAAALAILLIAFLFYRSVTDTRRSADYVTHTIEVIDQLTGVLSTLKDAETGQRGYLLTGNESYLLPYTNATATIDGQLASLRVMTADNPPQLRRVEALAALARDKMAELRETVELLRRGDGQAARAIVGTDRGRVAMDRIRAAIAEMVQDERALLAQRQDTLQVGARQSAAVVFGGSALLLLLIVVAGVLASREHRARESQNWIRAGQMGLTLRLQGEQRLATLSETAVAFLASYLDAHAAVIHAPQADGSLKRIASYALPAGADTADSNAGTGLLGQAARERRTIVVRDVPPGYFSVESSLGSAGVRQLLIAPAVVDLSLQAVMEFGFFRPITRDDEELVARTGEALAIAIRTSADRTRLEDLLEETQRQAEELQTQQEELRVSNEELAEQGMSLKESTARLEEQRAELEQTNAQLEEQAELLESQKEALAEAQTRLQRRASDLEQANQYKSEFLANMSHELRTPLNSTLILSKLLADNKDGNLAAEQVRFAETIYSAGNDLLALINDILDLSKIEARKIELEIAPLRIRETAETLSRALAPLAQQKHVGFAITVDPSAPEQIESDGQRIAQIIRNLVSNAVKFTEHGDVTVRVYSSASQTVSFSVHDTGIGIAPDQQEVIFEAFRQADGSTHRKYGGTGLGLSISRDLARLLGGDIAVSSEPGRGSTFTLTIPVSYSQPAGGPGDGATVRTAGKVQSAQPSSAPATGHRARTAPDAQGEDYDDRAHLTPGSRRILVIEDDLRFASILRDLAHELGYQCVIAPSAREGLLLAHSHSPSAVLLDINLPDKSGLAVLDQMKRDPELRALPVHILSVADYSREALERGAIGYSLKPVKRDELVDAFTRLEAKFSQNLRRVLVVEDDERQRDSIRQLLSMNDVEITDARNAVEALEALRTTTFDCMVMDLNLPDLSGYQLLQKMADHEVISFPPVIVYTGRALNRDEEQALRRFATSIIIKGARSPERLLDEVTLFLHQVEAKMPPDHQRMLRQVRARDATLEGRRILVVEDDVRNVFALTSVLEPYGAIVQVARNGKEALVALQEQAGKPGASIDLVLMDIMMPEMDGLTAMREIRKRHEWNKLPVIALTAKAMPDDQESCLAAGANDYIAKPLDAEKLVSLVRVWMPKSRE